MPDSPIISHQTVRLGPGKHRSPADGACVMELASMLAGEPFTDRPRTACPVLGAFLRAYNDSVRSARRQELVPCASLVVGTRSPRLQRERIRRLVRASVAHHDAQPRWRRTLHWHRRRRLLQLGRQIMCASSVNELGGLAAAVLTTGRDGHRVALGLVAELARLGAPATVPAPAPTVAPDRVLVG